MSLDPVSTADLKERILDCQLLSAEELRSAESSIPSGTDSGKALADLLVRAGKLTPYQANCLLGGRAQMLSVGSYVILEPIGVGGMGQVYRARHRATGDLAAIKLLPNERLRSPDALKRFEREISIARKIKHPAVARVLDGAAEPESAWYAMEYVEGSDLQQYVERYGTLSLEVAANYIVQSARGLDCLHEMGIVHRDIKPANLILATDGTVKLVDLGLARLDSRAIEETPEHLTMLTDTGAAMGSVDYMAPEQAIDARSVDQRADLYGLGCTFFFLLNGRPPFQRNTKVETLLAHAEDKIPALTRTSGPRTRAVQRLYGKLMAKQAGARYSSARQLATDLEAAVRQPERERLSRHAILATAMIALLLLLLAGGAVTSRVWKSPRAASLPAAGATNLGDAGEVAPTATSANSIFDHAMAPPDLDQYELLLCIEGQLATVNLATRVQRPLSGQIVEGHVPTWSPVGTGILFRRGNPGNLFSINADGTQLTELTQETDRHVTFGSWSPDGSEITFTAMDEGDTDLWTMRADGSNLQRLTDNGYNEWHPAWSPDGQWIVYVSEPPDSNPIMQLVQPDGTNLRRLPIAQSGWGPAWHPSGEELAFHARVEGGSEQLFIAQADGSGVRQITFEGILNANSSWSPDGRYLAYAHVADGSSQQWLEGCAGEIRIYDRLLNRSETLLRCHVANGSTRLSWKPQRESESR